ncbi:ribosome recycling factor [Kyrpidia spormannii]|uniref:Ribosome-recycling factor n=3 Tax=Alicyclobacillaceae TaxID=186823 RepID=A0A2K8N6P1_9BACL|nr:ribosome recycling factor [Kyrpidia spormannii]CAB3392452.1 ribosome recycling factor [Kyrpidia spormannii]CAB3393378.1 ribosome recycling factor [Kyrpidia spormannii]HHY67989.1 ribosome recycling factor [Alicyclobacillus sp.]
MSDLLKQAEERMNKSLQALKKEFASVRAGRATPGLLDKVTVEYYGTSMPIHQLASITAPEPRLLVIQPWDKGALAEIEKAILKSDLGLTPTNDGQVIRLAIPQLTQERRQELARMVRKLAEESRVAIRNIRREANDEIKKSEKDGSVSEDEGRRLQERIQGLTDRFIEEIDRLLAAKEKEITEV